MCIRDSSCTVTFTVSPESLQVTMAGESHFSDFIPFLLGSHACSFCECAQLSSETPPQEGQCAKTHRAWSPAPQPPTDPFQGGPQPLFRLEIYSAVSMRFRWRPVRTRRRQSRSKVPAVGSEGHFWRALAPLLEAKVAQCCMCCLLYTSPSPRDRTRTRMPSSA